MLVLLSSATEEEELEDEVKVEVKVEVEEEEEQQDDEAVVGLGLAKLAETGSCTTAAVSESLYVVSLAAKTAGG